MTDKTLYDLLSEMGVPPLKSYRPGHTEKVICPRCGGGATRDHCLSVTIAIDGMSAMYQCFRTKCDGFKGKVFVSERVAQKPKPQPRYAGPFSSEHPLDEQPDWFWNFWSERRIGKKTLDHFGIYATKHRDIGDSIVFPYRWNGKLINRKYRGYPNKDFRNDPGTQPTLFNVDSLEPGKPALWQEGELDVMTAHEAGHTRVVSLRDGAPQKPGQSEKRYEALTTHAELLDKIPVHILCPDADAPGEAWLEDLSRRLGRERCKIVRWPKGRKDANDTLCMIDDDPANTIDAAIEQAKWFPLSGVQDVDHEVIEKVWERERPTVMTLGVAAIDAKLRFPTEGKLIIITGIPSHGKSTFMRFVAMRTNQRYQRKWLVFVQEDDFDDYVIDCTKAFSEKSYRDITRDDRKIVGLALMNGGLRFFRFGRREQATIDTMLEKLRFSILRDGTTDFLIDPFNWVEDAYDHKNMTQTEHIGETLRKLKAFAQDYSCNVWVVAHPKSPGNERVIPDGYSVSGSANWINMSDLGITIHRDDEGNVGIHIWKSRTQRWATLKTVAKAWFNMDTGTYHEPLPKDDGNSQPPPPHWQDDN